MKRLLLVGISLLAVSACVPPAAPPPAATVPAAQPSGPAPGSPTNTTAAFDGNYGRPVITAKSSGCPDLSLPPYFVIQGGHGVLQGYNLSFQGYVNPQGALTMTDGFGRVFQGQISPQFNFVGRLTGQNCVYDMSWARA
jgi:hypothetical protein